MTRNNGRAVRPPHLIPSLGNQNLCAQSRKPMDMITPTVNPEITKESDLQRLGMSHRHTISMRGLRYRQVRRRGLSRRISTGLWAHERIEIGDVGIHGGDHALREVKGGVISPLLQL
jgi:hypothetical protein